MDTSNKQTVMAEGTAPRIVRLPQRKHSHFNVRPRYTAGSPAAVDRATAEAQADQEIEFCKMNASGVFGQENAEVAVRLGVGPVDAGDGEGLRSPAEYVEEHSNHWLVQCLCTGEIFTRPFFDAKPSRKVCKRCRDAEEFTHVRRLPEVITKQEYDALSVAPISAPGELLYEARNAARFILGRHLLSEDPEAKEVFDRLTKAIEGADYHAK